MWLGTLGRVRGGREGVRFREGIERYDPGATREWAWVMACAQSLIVGGLYTNLYTPLNRMLSRQ